MLSRSQREPGAPGRDHHQLAIPGAAAQAQGGRGRRALRVVLRTAGRAAVLLQRL